MVASDCHAKMMFRAEKQGTVGAKAGGFRSDLRVFEEREAHGKATRPGKAGERTSLIGTWKVSKMPVSSAVKGPLVEPSLSLMQSELN